MTRAHGRQTGHAFDAEGFVEVFEYVILHAGDRRFVGRHRRHQRAELRLATLALHHHQQHFGHILGNFFAMVPSDHRQRQVDAGGDTTGGDQVAVLNKDLVGFDGGRRECLDQAFGVMPMRGHAIPVEQPRMPEHKRPGADRAITGRAANVVPEPVKQRRMFFVVGTGATGHQQQVIAVAGLIDKQVGVHAYTVGCPQCARLGADGRQHVVIVGFEIAIGDGKHLQGACHVEQEEVGEQHHCHGFHGLEITVIEQKA
ncbi:hypothetical protein D3C87_1439970 [compost metagenome]